LEGKHGAEGEIAQGTFRPQLGSRAAAFTGVRTAPPSAAPGRRAEQLRDVAGLRLDDEGAFGSVPEVLGSSFAGSPLSPDGGGNVRYVNSSAVTAPKTAAPITVSAIRFTRLRRACSSRDSRGRVGNPSSR
jgi:hypothetical protein